MFIAAFFVIANTEKSKYIHNRWMDKPAVVHPHHGILLSSDSKLTPDTCYKLEASQSIILSKRRQTKEGYIQWDPISVRLWNAMQHSDQKQIRGCLGIEVGTGREGCKRAWGNTWRWQIGWLSHSFSGVCLCQSNTLRTTHVKFIVCPLGFKKASNGSYLGTNQSQCVYKYYSFASHFTFYWPSTFTKL